MEYVEGTTLAAWLKQRPLDDAAVRRLIGDVARGLKAIHAAGYLHRDVSPTNILLKTDGTAVIIDFGIVKSLRAEPGLTETDSDFGKPSSR